MKEKLEQILPQVRKPARYIGNEFNSIHKDWDSAKLRIAIGYPDLYEVGMSNLGIQILYHILNSQSDVLAERFFAPAPDMEQQLTANNLPLFSLESWTPLNKFDMIGFSIGHELSYTNIVTILKLSGIPLHSKDRNDSDPLIFAGGPSVYNPEPIADFVDFFVIGEGEEVVLDIVKTRSQIPGSRSQLLNKLSKIPGVYVPSIGNMTKKRYVKDLDFAPVPTKPVVPFISAVHDRAVIEIMRGCSHGCKFCSAFSAYKPVRERSSKKVIELADELLKNTGYEELSLISLSTSDYSQVEHVAKFLADKYEKKKINIAVPSLRLDSIGIKLMKDIQKVRPSSVTAAPEAGTQRLRDLINKDLSEEQILSGIKAAFSEGITNIKLYFMIGLPTETEEDLLGIVALVKKTAEIGFQFSNKAHITASASTFIPKPHTPFELERQISLKEITDKQKFLRQNLRGRGIEFRWHDGKTSVLEGIFSRGDKRLSRVVEEAWSLGCRLDAWSEYFNFELWEKAFSNCGITMDEYLTKKDQNEALPWSNISCSL